MTLTVERLRDLLIYDAATGTFTNRTTRHHAAKKGDVAGSKTAGGYMEIGIDGGRYLAHRLAWLYVTGEWPKQMVDHRDGNGTNNKWTNLRSADATINMQNQRKAPRSNRSGVFGAHRVGKRFKSSIRVNDRIVRLGYFATAEEAAAAYLEAKRRLHEGCTL